MSVPDTEKEDKDIYIYIYTRKMFVFSVFDIINSIDYYSVSVELFEDNLVVWISEKSLWSIDSSITKMIFNDKKKIDFKIKFRLPSSLIAQSVICWQNFSNSALLCRWLKVCSTSCVLLSFDDDVVECSVLLFS